MLKPKRLLTALIFAVGIFIIQIAIAESWSRSKPFFGELGKAMSEICSASISLMILVILNALIGGFLMAFLIDVIGSIPEYKRRKKEFMEGQRKKSIEELLEDQKKKTSDPERNGFIPEKNHEAGATVFGCRIPEGDPLAEPVIYSSSEKGNIGIYGNGKMRHMSGFVIPNIFKSIDRGTDLIIQDDCSGTIFSQIYAPLLFKKYDIIILNPEAQSSEGYNLLASVTEKYGMFNLARNIVKRAGLMDKQKTAVTAILAGTFTILRMENPEATLADAYEYLTSGEITDFIYKAIIASGNSQSEWLRLDTNGLNEYTIANMDKLLRLSSYALKPFAEKAFYNSGMTAARYKSMLEKSERKPVALILKGSHPNGEGYFITPFILWDILSQIEGQRRLFSTSSNLLPNELQVFLNDFSPFQDEPNWDAIFGFGNSSNIWFTVNFQCVPKDNAYHRYSIKHYVLTGTPNKETASFLSEKAGKDYSLGAFEIVRDIVTDEELLGITKEEVIVITPDKFSAVKFKKLYSKLYAYADLRILNTETGEIANITIDTFNPEDLEKYTIITSGKAAKEVK